eukprot:268401_1
MDLKVNMHGGHKFYTNIISAINNCLYDIDNIAYLLHCIVICGESSNILNDQKPNKSYILYDTLVENINLKKNKYYIIYKDFQSIPLNIICIKQKIIKKQPIKKPLPPKQKPYQFDSKIFLQHFNQQQQQQQQHNQPPQPPFPPQQIIRPDNQLPNIPNIPNRKNKY